MKKLFNKIQFVICYISTNIEKVLGFQQNIEHKSGFLDFISNDLSYQTFNSNEIMIIK